ncbi:Cof-type HAD-IIB family hydrolase [Anaerorhabdus sp.]|uniref:Cof-type HAD-IIB family hydrolase n=1 Tax=Anaerorhabdus sp. TaxID=1872524 RepID=UPI002FCC8DE9
MTIKLIAMDMDGTLLTSDNKILPETKAALLAIQATGVRLVLASGRSYTKLMEYAKELEMDRYAGYLIEINGTAIYDLQENKRYVKKLLNAQQIHEIFAYFRQWDVEIIGHVDDGMYDYNPPAILNEKKIYKKAHHLSDDYPLTGGAFHFIADNRKGYPRLTYINNADEIVEELNKISVTYHEEIIEKISIQAKQELGKKYWIGKTSPKWLEIMLPGITKASGLEDIAQRSGISLDEMMAFGDGENDIAMLQAVRVGIAMGNAMDSVKTKANECTQSNQDNGIANALKKHFKI